MMREAPKMFLIILFFIGISLVKDGLQSRSI